MVKSSKREIIGVKYADLPDLLILKSPAVSVDDEGNMVWENGNMPRDYTEAITQIKDQLVENILEWDHKNIQAVWDNITDLEQISFRLEDEIDLSDLSTEPIPEGLETYPIWAIDKDAMCLVGVEQLTVEPLSDIKEHYLTRKPDYCTQASVEACYLCSLVNYKKDCMNNPVRYPEELE